MIVLMDDEDEANFQIQKDVGLGLRVNAISAALF
jgi:hypothetical protein